MGVLGLLGQGLSQGFAQTPIGRLAGLLGGSGLPTTTGPTGPSTIGMEDWNHGATPAAVPSAAPMGTLPAPAPAAPVAPVPTGWLAYANQGATRNDPLAPQLVDALDFLPDLGVRMEVFSGGQENNTSSGTGSTRHNHGNAADVFFYDAATGRRLDWANPEDVPRFQEIVRRAHANGVTGFGAGEGYMRPGSMHVGFGAPAVWGAGGSGANAPDWLRAAYSGSTPSATPSAAPAASVSAMNAPQPAGGGMARSSSTGSTSQGGLLSMPEQAPRRPSLWDHVPGLADPDRRSRMIIALQGMTMNPNEGLVHMAQGDLDASRKSAEQQRMMAWLAQQPGGEQFAAMMGAGFDANGVASAYLQSQAPKAPVIEGGMVFDPVTGEMIHDYRQQDGQDPTTAMQNYQALVALGVPSEDAIKQAFGSGGTTVNVGADGQRYAPPPTGYAVVEDPNSPAGVRYELIPGSEPAVEAANANAGAAETAQRESVQTRVVLQQVQGVRDILDNPGLVPDAGVFGQVMTGMGLNQQGQDLNNRLTTIKSAVAYDRLESLRAGGGMGQVSDTDMAMLGVALGNLDPSSSPQVLRESLDTIERVMGKIGGAAPQAAPQAAAPAPATSQPAPAAPQPAAQPQPAPAPATTAPDPQQAIAQVPLMNWQQLNDLLASYGGVANVPPEVRAAVTARAAQIQQGS